MSSTAIFQAKTKRQPFFRLRKLIPFALGPVFLVSLFLFHQKSLTINKISCNPGGEPCPPAVESLVQQLRGKSFLRLNQQQIKRDIIATGFTQAVEIKIKLPSELTIFIQPTTATYYLKSVFSNVLPSLSYLQATSSAQIILPSIELERFVATTSGKTFALLGTGFLDQADQNTNFYLIDKTIPSKDYLQSVFSWLRAFSQSQIKSDSIFFWNNLVVIKQNNAPDLLLNRQDDPREVILALQRLNSTVTMEKPAVIDFRYNHPILIK